jgi:hypothetical protein
MRSLSTEQIILFFLVFGLPLLKSLAGLVQKRSSSSANGEPAAREEHEKEFPWFQLNEAKPVAPSAVQHDTRQAPIVPVRHVAAVAPPAGRQRKQVQRQAAGKRTSPALRQIPRDPAGQRRAIVLSYSWRSSVRHGHSILLPERNRCFSQPYRYPDASSLVALSSDLSMLLMR